MPNGENMDAMLAVLGSLYESLGDESWRYGLLSGVENEVERSSIKRKAFPSGVQLHPASSILGHLCNVLVCLGLKTS